MEMAPHVDFVYAPLKRPNHIRLIKISPSRSQDDPIRIRLLETSLRDPCEYQTLSYTWGETSVASSHCTPTIFCEQLLLPVKPNLHHFLLRLRSRLAFAKATRLDHLPIWIDALCINQADLDERGKQVAMMAEIYYWSRRLIIWLGELNIPNGLSWPFQPAIGRFVKFEPGSDEASTMRQILALPWFQRRWIIQEVLHTYKAARILWIGTTRVPWARFVLAVRRAKFEHAVFPKILRYSIDVGDRSNPRVSLIQNLWLWDYARCGEAPDRVYALLSISKSGKSIPVDYTIDTETVYRRVAMYIAESEAFDSLPGLLLCALLYAPDGPRSSFPTWVPDWRNGRRSVTKDESKCIELCLETPDSSGMDPQVPAEVVDERCIRLRGWLIPGCQCEGSSCKGCSYIENVPIRMLDLSRKVERRCACARCVVRLLDAEEYLRLWNVLNVPTGKAGRLCILNNSIVGFGLVYLGPYTDGTSICRLRSCLPLLRRIRGDSVFHDSVYHNGVYSFTQRFGDPESILLV